MNSTFNSSSPAGAPTPVFLFVSCVAVLLLSPPLNVYTMWLIVKGGAESINSDFYRLNLSLSETLGCFSCLFTVLYALHADPALITGYAFFVGFVHIARPMFQICICVECYLAVVHPVTFLRYKLLRHKVACSSAVWLLSLAGCLNTVFCQVCVTSSLGHNVLLGYYTLLFASMLFCCMSVLRALKQPGPGEGRRRRAEGYDAKRRAFNIVTVTTVMTVVNYFPYALLLTVHSRITLERFSELADVVAPFLFYFGLFPPLFYLQRVGKLSLTHFLTAMKCTTNK